MNIGYPFVNPVKESAFKKNLKASGCEPLPEVVVIPVIIPEEPWTVVISKIFSKEIFVVGAITCGGLV